MRDLFSDLDDARHQRLRAAGWQDIYEYDSVFWQRPGDGARFSEAEALAQLVRTEKESPS